MRKELQAELPCHRYPIESDGQLHPIEIKKSINPPTQITGAFKLLDKASVPRGTGAIPCLRETLSAIDSSTYIVPVWIYEPWTIDNFIVDSDVKNAAIEKTQELVKACLNYPSTADFPWSDWSVGRSFNWYSVSSRVTAKNAFGVESEIPFVAIFWVEGNSIRPIYLEVNSEIVRDDRGDYPLPERKEVEVPVQPSESGTIHIVDGQLGDYGKKVQLDSYEYEWYMVPAGKYEAVSNVKTCTVYVDKDEITRNSSGYVEMQNVATYTWNYGETIEIEVGEGEHLFNVYGADYILTPIS